MWQPPERILYLPFEAIDWDSTGANQGRSYWNILVWYRIEWKLLNNFRLLDYQDSEAGRKNAVPNKHSCTGFSQSIDTLVERIEHVFMQRNEFENQVESKLVSRSGISGVSRFRCKERNS